MMWLSTEACYSEPAEVAFLEMCKLGWAKALSTGGISVPQLRCWPSFGKKLGPDDLCRSHPSYFFSVTFVHEQYTSSV